MLPPDRIKPYLRHEDQFVRRAAVDYFAESWSRDPDIIPMVLDACDRYGDRENVHGTSHFDHFTFTATALDRVLAHLARTGDRDTLYHLNRAIAQAPADLLIAREAEIGGHPNILPRIRPRLERRREFEGWSGERLWQELQDFARRSEDKRYAGEIDHDYSDDLVDALARHDVPDVETLCRLLREFAPEEEIKPEEGWLEVFLVDLAGARRVPRAIPALVDKFYIDTDYLLERCMRSLARIGDPEASRLIREAYPEAEDHFRIYTADVFGAIKHPDSEEAILAVLGTETDPTHRTILCAALCELFSERGVEVVRREIASGYDRSYTTLEDHLLPVAEVLGIELPEADRWRRERAERERRYAARLAELEHIGRRSESPEGPVADPFAWLGRADEIEPAAPTLPIRRETRKVGRNDPCPCGSGKKYKKCCGRAG